METSGEKRIEKLIDGLAEVIAEGFSNFNEKFEVINSKLEGHDRQFEIINSKLESHDRQFETINYKLDSLLERVGKVESDIKNIRGVLDDMSVLETKSIKTNKFLLAEVKRLDKELARIKKVLKIA